VYGWERLVLLKHLLEQGLPKTEIAARLGVSRGLIYHWLRTGQLAQEVDALCPPPRAAVGRDEARPLQGDHHRAARHLS